MKKILGESGLDYTITKVKEYLADKDIRTSVPVGGSITWYGPESTIPDDYMREDGRSLNKNEYLDLFNIIGYTYGGSGDSFNIPDSRGRVIVHLSDDVEFNELGQSGGSKQLQKHSHDFYGYGFIESSSRWGTKNNADEGDKCASKNLITDETGEGDSGNLQPYITSYRIIKVKQDIYTKNLTELDKIVNNLTNQINTLKSNMDTYVKRTILWENPDQNFNQTFETQKIIIDSDDYDELEFIFLTDYVEPLTFTQKITKGMGAQAQYMSYSFDRWWVRRISRESDICFDIGDAVLITTGQEKQIQNNFLIPLKVVGIKNLEQPWSNN